MKALTVLTVAVLTACMIAWIALQCFAEDVLDAEVQEIAIAASEDLEEDKTRAIKAFFKGLFKEVDELKHTIRKVEAKIIKAKGLDKETLYQKIGEDRNGTVSFTSAALDWGVTDGTTEILLDSDSIRLR